MAGQTRVEPKLTQKCLHVACHANILHHLPNGRVGNQRGGGVSHGVQGRWLKGETPLKGGGSRGSNICMQDWARAHVQSGVVVVCCCSCSGLRSRPLYQNQTTRPPPPVENPSQKYPPQNPLFLVLFALMQQLRFAIG